MYIVPSHLLDWLPSRFLEHFIQKSQIAISLFAARTFVYHLNSVKKLLLF